MNRWLKISGALGVCTLSLWLGARGLAQNGAGQIARPQYKLDLKIDYDLLTYQSAAQVAVPVQPGDAVQDAVFYIYADANGVGGADGQQKNVVVDKVTFNGEAVPFNLQGAILRVTLPQAQTAPFTLAINSRGVVPRSAAGPGGLMEMMGGLSGDLGDMLGGLGGLGGAPKQEAKKKENTDYGLYTSSGGMVSLGSFWYPALAVRQNGRWVEEQPEGLGDVEYAEMTDFDVTIHVPENVVVAATGEAMSSPRRGDYHFVARGVRDFAVLASADYVVTRKDTEVGGASVRVEAYTLKKDVAKADKVIDIATHALQIYAKRFGPYPYSNFKVVEGPIKGGAGGMEFSGLTSISAALYGDLGKQLSGLAGALGGGNLDGLLGGLEEDGGEPAPQKTATKPAAPENPASELLQSLLGQQKGVFDSIFEMTIAHEVGHQWWAIGVGSDSQRTPFVDESLTNYSAILYFEDRYGAATAQKMADLHLRTTYSTARMLGSTDAPANRRTSAYTNNIQYGAVVYGKGALFYDAARHAMGDLAFNAALREYYGRYHNRIAGPRALLDIMKSKAPTANIDGLYKHWIEETHGDEDIGGGSNILQDLLGGMLGGMGAEE